MSDNGNSGDMPEQSAYSYDPSEAAALVFTALYAISGLIAVVQLVRRRAWIWLIMILSIAMETAGFAIRFMSAREPDNQNLYSISFVLIVLAPVLIAGVTYVVFGRILFQVVPPSERKIRVLWAPARWVTPIFVLFDILALLLQLVGAVMLTGADETSENFLETVDRGRSIAIAGVVVQLVAFGFFSVVAGRFQMIASRFSGEHQPLVDSSRSSAKSDEPSRAGMGWRRLLMAVVAVCALILIRSIYRLVEFVEGREGYIMNNEWPLYVLDAAPMLAVCVIFNVFNPGRYVQMGFRQREVFAPIQGIEMA